MLTFYHCKPTFQNWLRPAVQQLATWQVSPNQVTVLAIVLSVVMGVAIAYFPQSHWVFFTLPIVLLGRMALNAIDGMLAREHNLTTPLGCVLNELGDVMSDIALYLPFSLIPGISSAWIVAIILLTTLTEVVGILGGTIAHKRCYDGPMGKSDRALIFGTLSLAIGLGLTPAPWLTGIWIGVIGLQFWTIVNRTRAILREAVVCN
jgi:CDP-diacylglycerol---glycerol-3-phosphate 3-phosphatidyltransferase